MFTYLLTEDDTLSPVPNSPYGLWGRKVTLNSPRTEDTPNSHCGRYLHANRYRLLLTAGGQPHHHLRGVDAWREPVVCPPDLSLHEQAPHLQVERGIWRGDPGRQKGQGQSWRNSFSSVWHLCALKNPYALHPVYQKFPQRCFWISSCVRLTAWRWPSPVLSTKIV